MAGSSNKKSFTDLETWKEGHKLVIMVFAITGSFPKKNASSLIDQMHRSSASVTGYIAEGHWIMGYQEKIRAFNQAHSSLTSLKNQFIIARDVGFIKNKDFESLMRQTSITHQLIQKHISSSKTLKS